MGLLLDEFKEEKREKLIGYVKKENKYNQTALHYAANKGYEGIVKLLLDTFNEEDKDKLIEYVMEKDDYGFTALHHAAFNKHEGIVKLLFKRLREVEKAKLIEYVKIEDDTKKYSFTSCFKGIYRNCKIVIGRI